MQLLATIVLLGVSAAPAVAQVVWSDDFDDYVSGSVIDGQGGWESAGAMVSSDTALSGPNALAIDDDPGGFPGDDAAQSHDALDLTSGAWAVHGSVYVPDGHSGVSYFLLFNTLAEGGNNTSAQVHFDGGDQTPSNRVVADFSGDSLPLVTGRWVPIRVVIDLDAGEDAGDGTPVGRQLFFYNGNVLYEGPWRGQVSSVLGSSQNIAGTVFFNNGASVVYYDDLSIEAVNAVGACCLDDGGCLVDVADMACAAQAGVFQGVGSTCSSSVCYELSPDGWLVDLPDQAARPGGWTWGSSTGHADTCDETDDCDLSDANDIQWVITFVRDAEYILSVCDAEFDSVLSIGSASCGNDIAESDDAVSCGTASEIRAPLTAGTYYVTLEGFQSGLCGPFTLNIRELCPPLPVDPKSVRELESCGDDTNGGCTSDTPVFEPIACDTTIHGSGWAGADMRDTDWFELELTETTTVTITGYAERSGWAFGLLDTGGVPDCTGGPSVLPFDVLGPCFEDQPAVVQMELTAGTWWLFAAPPFGAAIDCGDLDAYELAVRRGDTCVPSTSGDTDGDGFTDFVDLLNVLAAWGICSYPPPASCVGDVDCTGSVNFVDLLTVLAGWNPAP